MAQTHPGLWSLKYFLPGMLFPEIFIRLFPSCHLDLSLNLPSSASLLWPHRRYLFHSPVLLLCILCSTCHYLALFCWLICLLTIWELHGSPLRTGTFFALVTSVSSGLRAGMVEPVSWLCNACINLWCWQNAIATNMTPTGAHNLGCRWVGETLFSEMERVKRRSLWGHLGKEREEALVFHLRNCFSARETQSLMETESELCWGRGEADLKREECLCPLTGWSVSMQIKTLNPHSLIGPKNTILIGQNEAALMGQWRCKWGYSCAAPIGWGKSQSHWSNFDPRSSLIRLYTDGRSTMQEAWQPSQSVAFPWNTVCIWGLCKKWLLYSGYEFEPN